MIIFKKTFKKFFNKIYNKLYKFLLKNIWYTKKLNFIYILLFYIFEIIFRFIVFIRKILYKHNIFKTYKFKVPVIIIGNITVGGTGKTPLVIYIVNYLQSQGFKPAIVSRGYKAKTNQFINIITAESDPSMYGDEPVLLARATNCPVVTGKDKVSAINYLLETFNNINVIICDDGLQHYKLARDLEIALIDKNLQIGNGHMLPLGPLREPISRLQTVDILINNNINLNYQNINQKNLNQKQYTINLVPDLMYNLANINSEFNSGFNFFAKYTTVHAVAGIGNNQNFFDLLNNFGVKVIEHEFADHYNYQEQDLNFADDLPIIMTEKDAVKCLKFAKNNFWCQTVKVEFNLPEEFNDYLINFLRKYA